MKSRTHLRALGALTVLALAGLALTGCSSGSASAASAGTADGVVTISGPITDQAAKLLEKSWSKWEKANHIKIVYTGSTNFEEQIGGQAQQGNAPDLAIFEQPGLLGDLASLGYIQKLTASEQKEVKANFPAEWAKYTTFKGSNYATPLLATLNGWVFYSPSKFASLGVSVPKTWAQLWTLTQQIQQKTNKPVWCEGFNSGDSSGSAGTNWIEDFVLREDGPAVYDKWVSHAIPFSDPRIQLAFDDAHSILLDPKYVNAGIGGVASIATATEADVAKAFQSGSCVMTHQSSDFVGDLKAGTPATGGDPTIGPDGDYWAFMLPPTKSSTTPVTGGGDFVAAFSNDADTQKVQAYLASDAWAKSRVALGGVISPDRKIDSGSASSPLLRESISLLENPGTTFRFDASDLMPAIVGSGSFWTGMMDWVKGKQAPAVLATIDKSWPSD